MSRNYLRGRYYINRNTVKCTKEWRIVRTIATRQTMITEMNQKVEAERLRLNLDHENIIHGSK